MEQTPAVEPSTAEELSTADDRWGPELAETYDTPGVGMFAPEAVEPAVARLAELAGGGPALEFAAGTGRITVPLARAGVPVTGIELSPHMIEQLRRKAGPELVPMVQGDMATTSAGEGFSLVYLVYNTIGNLLTQDAQVACFRNAARHLRPGGRFVIELEVPGLRLLPPGQDSFVFAADADHLGVDTYDLVSQRLVSHHVWMENGQPVKYGGMPQRYVWPAELDLMGRLAGFVLESRHADWTGSPFTAESRSHISVYRLPGDPSGDVPDDAGRDAGGAGGSGA